MTQLEPSSQKSQYATRDVRELTKAVALPSQAKIFFSVWDMTDRIGHFRLVARHDFSASQADLNALDFVYLHD